MGVLFWVHELASAVHDTVNRPGLTGRGHSRLTHLGCEIGGEVGVATHVLASPGRSSASNALYAA